MRKIVILFFLLGWMSAGISAQSHIVASGGNVTGDPGSISFTAGQIDFITQAGPAGILTEGVQQPFSINVVNGINETGITLDAVVYPNPASDYVELKLSQPLDPSLHYRLIDPLGRVLAKDLIVNETTRIEMSDLSNGVYYLLIEKDHDTAKTFQINITK
ncbi:MAG: T9SS type A sorting domain-containing protein [Saprospiraceae bacterium]